MAERIPPGSIFTAHQRKEESNCEGTSAKGNFAHRSVSKADSTKELKPNRSPEQPQALASRSVSSSQLKNSVSESQLNLLKKLVANEEWQGVNAAFNNYTPDLSSFKALRSEFPVEQRTKEFLDVISEHFIQCFAREKGVQMSLPASQSSQENSPFVLYETLNVI